MSLSEAYGGKPSYHIMSFAEYRQDLERMVPHDKAIMRLTEHVDDDIQLADLIATIKNLPQQQYGTAYSANIVVSPDVQP